MGKSVSAVKSTRSCCNSFSSILFRHSFSGHVRQIPTRTPFGSVHTHVRNRPDTPTHSVHSTSKSRERAELAPRGTAREFLLHFSTRAATSRRDFVLIGRLRNRYASGHNLLKSSPNFYVSTSSSRHGFVSSVRTRTLTYRALTMYSISR